MNPEEKLLIKLIQGSLEEKAYKNINWENFVKLCVYHRITSFVYQKLNKRLVPEKELKKLQNISKKTALCNLILNKELLSFSEEMKRKKIDFIVLKGMALNNTVYSKSFSRNSRDIDLLVKEKDYAEIKKALEKKGFVSGFFGLWKDKPFVQHYPAIKKEINGIQCVFELHNTIFFPVNSFSIDLNEMWNDSEKINKIKILGKEDSLIVAVLSAVYQHGFERIPEAIIDAKKLSEKTDGQKLKEKTIKYNAIEPMVYFNELMKEIFGTEIIGAGELEGVADKKKLSFLRKYSIEKIIQKKSPFSLKIELIKNRFYWTKGLKQKARVLFFVLIFPAFWRLKEFLESKLRIN